MCGNPPVAGAPGRPSDPGVGDQLARRRRVGALVLPPLTVFDQPPRISLMNDPRIQLCEPASWRTSVLRKWSPCVVFQLLPLGLRSSTFFMVVNRANTF